jgi:hypothetical protein
LPWIYCTAGLDEVTSLIPTIAQDGGTFSWMMWMICSVWKLVSSCNVERRAVAVIKLQDEYEEK